MHRQRVEEHAQSSRRAVAAKDTQARGPAQHPIHVLQQTIGNQAVQRLLDNKTAAQKPIEDEEDVPPKGAAAKRVAEKGAGGLAFQTSTAPVSIQRQPPPPPPAAPPAGRATINWLPVLADLVPAAWGTTRNDDPVFDITAYASGSKWKCKITTADQQSHQGVQLVAGVTEVTDALVAGESDCDVLKTMFTSLKDVADQKPDSGYYMIAAVQAHEDVHIRQYRAGLAPHYNILRTAVEALTVPFAAHPDADAAATAIKALPAFTTAMARFHSADVSVNNTSGGHSPAAPFKTAEHGVVDPMITRIKARRTALKCAP
jgi:hypothetical protein